MEIWKDIPGYEGAYQVSNSGRVKSLNYKCTGKERIMKLTKQSYGYLKIRFCKNGIKKSYWVHKLVAEAFIPNPHNYTVIHHIDHNPQNNTVVNLIWMDNNEHRGIHINEQMKTVYQYTLDGELVAVYESIHDASRQTNYTLPGISHCCDGGYFDKSRNKWHKSETYKGYRWSYVPL